MSFDIRLLSAPQLSVPAKAVAERIRDAYVDYEKAAA